jgi:hypothetical protein
MTGYYLAPNDKMAMVIDIMNMDVILQEVVFSVTWEYIPSPPNKFEKLALYWLDIGGCGSSYKPGQSLSDFHYSSPTKKSRTTGRVAAIAGHLHDGGTHLEVKKNGKIVCDSEDYYRGRHISNISGCQNVDTTSPGDKWSITAYYNTAKHQPMASHEGHLEPLMGIASAYVVETETHYVPHKHHYYRWLKITAALLVVSLVYIFIAVQTRSKFVWDLVPARFRKTTSDREVKSNATNPTLPLLAPQYSDEPLHRDKE